MLDLLVDLIKEFFFNEAKSLYDLIFVDGKEFVRFYNGAFRQDPRSQDHRSKA